MTRTIYRDFHATQAGIAQLLGIREGDAVWESGVGAGFFLEALDEFGNKSLRLGGADTSEGMLAAARARLQRHPQHAFYHADARNLTAGSAPGLRKQQYDKAVAFSVFQYFPTDRDAAAAADAMVDLVKDGGVVFVGNVYDEAAKPISVGSLEMMRRERCTPSREASLGVRENACVVCSRHAHSCPLAHAYRHT